MWRWHNLLEKWFMNVCIYHTLNVTELSNGRRQLTATFANCSVHKWKTLKTCSNFTQCAIFSFCGKLWRRLHYSMIRSVFLAIVCLSTYNVADWRYSQLKNPIFSFLRNSCVRQLMINYSKLAKVISNYLNFEEIASPKVQTTVGHNRIKNHNVLLVWERFIGSALFELISAFCLVDLIWGSS